MNRIKLYLAFFLAVAGALMVILTYPDQGMAFVSVFICGATIGMVIRESAAENDANR